jgi:methylmalonyl-CoA mutase
MNAIEHPNIFMRSLATRDTGKEVSAALPEVIAACKLAGFDLVIVETSGIGQGNAAIVPFVDVSLYVMTPEFGAASAAREDRHARLRRFRRHQQVRPQGRRGCAARRAQAVPAQPRSCSAQPTDDMPVFGTMAARFNDDGVTALYQALVPALAEKGLKLAGQAAHRQRQAVVQPARHRAGPARALPGRDRRQRARLPQAHTEEQVKIARERQSLRIAKRLFEGCDKNAGRLRRAASTWKDGQLTRRPKSCSTCGRRRSRPIPATSTW